MMMSLYKTLMRVSTPALGIYLEKRAARGKEDVSRAGERRGIAARPRGARPLVWFHAASVGESLSLLAIINRILRDFPGLDVMVTTGTVTSARLMAARLPAPAFHQYIPVDHPLWVQRFLDHWRPDVVLWAESELWPNMLSGLKERRVPAILLSARMSEKTFRRWKNFAPGMIADILSAFRLCQAQNEAEAARLRRLGAGNVTVTPSPKYAASPLPYDESALSALLAETGGRKMILWASTHPGEEKIAMDTHRALKPAFPDLLTVIVPRHPQRGGEIADMARNAGIAPALRSAGQKPGEIYIADTLGELGVFFRLCKNVVMGGSFVDIGGHNVIEPAQAGAVILSGPFIRNFITIMEDFRASGALIQLKGAGELAAQLSDILSAPDKYEGMAGAALKLTEMRASVVEDIMRDIAPFLAAAQGGKPC